jgi:type II secretory pathway pseudopilin PulG
MKNIRKNKGFTLIEVVITVALVAFMGISILGAIAFGTYQKQAIRERNGALRAASDLIESAKRSHFSTLARRDLLNVVIDDRGSRRSQAGDVLADISMRFFLENGTEVGIPGTPIPLNLSMVRAEVVVTWVPAGKGRGSLKTETLSTLMAP